MTWDLRTVANNLGNLQILAVAGRISGANADAFGAALDEAIAAAERGHGPLTVDLSGVDYISSGGLRVLRNAADRRQTGGSTLVLAGVQEAVMITLDLGGVLPVVRVEANEI